MIESLDTINKRETNLLDDLHKAKAGALETDICPFGIGDIISITNHLCDEYGTVGELVHIGKKCVTIRKSDTNKRYWRTWYTLNIVESATPQAYPRNAQKCSTE